MTIFDQLNDILFSKRGECLDNVDDESQFQPYMINRWCSMYSPAMAQIVNSTTNRLYNTFVDKQQFYKFVTGVFPKLSRKRIHYIKKNKPDPEQQPENLKTVARALELSEREIKSYYEHSSQHNASTTRASQS